MNRRMNIAKLKKKLMNIFIRELIRPKRIFNILACMGFFAFLIAISSFVLTEIYPLFHRIAPPFLFSIFIYSFLATAFLSLPLSWMVDLRIFFSDSFLEEKPKKPTEKSIMLGISLFLIIILIPVLGGFSGFGRKIIILFFAIIIVIYVKYLLRLKKEDEIFSIAGRIFTYTGFSTAVYLMLSGLIFEALSWLFKDLFPVQIGQVLQLPVRAIVVPAIVTFLFFDLKERVFEYYGEMITFQVSRVSKKKKEVLDEHMRILLQSGLKGRLVDFDKLSKEAYLIKLEIEHLTQEIEKAEKNFEFHRSLGLNVLTQPFWIYLIFEMGPRFLDLFENLKGF